MSESSEQLWQSTFQPDSAPNGHEALREAFLAQRAEAALQTLRLCNDVMRTRGSEPVPEKLLELITTRQDAVALVLDDPVFAIWLRFFLRAMANDRAEELGLHLSNLQSVLEDVEIRLTGRAELYAPGSPIAVQREGLNPYAMAAAPPTYDFTRVPRTEEDEPLIGHPLALQAELVGCAIEGIGRTWPALKDQVLEYVRIVGYLPDASFRSCSAARYSGIVYLGNMDESILDLEESLVHETGHQVLYRLGEITRLTRPETPLEANHVLPWSGSRRDLFGFLHAYYIYALLTKYFWRRAARGDRDANDSMQRAVLILRGLLLATPRLKSDPNLSDQGRFIVEALADEVEQLKDEMRVKLQEYDGRKRKKKPQRAIQPRKKRRTRRKPRP